MRSISSRVLVVCMAVCVMSAVVAASASAYTNPILENSKSEALSTTFTSEARDEAGSEGAVRMQGGVGGILCEGETGTGTVKTTGAGTARKTSGEASVKLTGCTGLGIGGRCSTKGDKSGEITTTVAFSLAWVGKESGKEPGILTSIGPEGKLTVTCDEHATELEGSYVSQFKGKLGEALTTDSFIARQNGGVQDYKKYTEEGKEAENSILWSFAGSTFETMGVEAQNELTFKEKVKIAES
jgi:hypothetical protein